MPKYKIRLCFTLIILTQVLFCYYAEGASDNTELVSDLNGKIKMIIQQNEKLLSEFSRKKKELDGLISKRDALMEEQMRLESENEQMSREIDDLKTMIKEIIRSLAQEKEFAKLLLKERPILKAKLKKTEMRWDYATRLYNQKKYEEAIRVFEEIIKLEGEKQNEKKN